MRRCGPDDIAILSTRRLGNSLLAGRDRVGGYRLVEAGGPGDPGRGDLLFSTMQVALDRRCGAYDGTAYRYSRSQEPGDRAIVGAGSTGRRRALWLGNGDGPSGSRFGMVGC